MFQTGRCVIKRDLCVPLALGKATPENGVVEDSHNECGRNYEVGCEAIVSQVQNDREERNNE